MRQRAEPELARTGQRQRPLVRAVLKGHLVQRGGGDVSLDLAGQPPRLERDGFAAGQHRARRPRQRQRAVEARPAAFEGQKAVGLDRQRTLIGLQTEAQPHAFGTGSSGRNLVAVESAAGDELTLAPDRTGASERRR